jgi:hypothetical protein
MLIEYTKEKVENNRMEEVASSSTKYKLNGGDYIDEWISGKHIEDTQTWKMCQHQELIRSIRETVESNKVRLISNYILSLESRIELLSSLWLLRLLRHSHFDSTGFGDEVVHASLIQLNLVNDSLGRVRVLFLCFLFALSVILEDLGLHIDREFLGLDF